MKELSLNILDIVQNSVAAGAKKVVISVGENSTNEKTVISVSDDGHGMDAELLKNVTDPFTTTRTTRNIGLGIPLLKMEAEMAGGSFEIVSTLGVGTKVTATFISSHIDMPPIGDMAGTVITVIQGNPDLNLDYERSTAEKTFIFKSDEVREALGGIPLDTPEVLDWIGEYIAEGESSLG